MRKLTSEEIGKFADGTKFRLYDESVPATAGTYKKEGSLLFNEKHGGVFYRIADVDDRDVSVFKAVVPDEEAKRCVDTIEYHERLFGMLGENREKIVEATKRGIANMVATAIMRKGYMQEGYSIRYAWQESKINLESSLCTQIEYTLKAYIIRDKEDGVE